MSEYFTELRRKVGDEAILVPGIVAIVVGDGGRVLVCRSASRIWGLPGGAMDLGETVRESLRRQLHRVGLDASNESLLGVYSGPRLDTTGDNGERTARVAIAFVVREHAVVPHESVPHESVPHESVPHESVPHESVPHESVPHESVPHDDEDCRAPRFVAPDALPWPFDATDALIIEEYIERGAGAPRVD